MVGFGERLKQARNELNLTQEQLAARLGISRVALGSYETDTRFPTIDTLIRISSELHLSVEYLLDLPRGGETIDVSDLEPNEVAMIRMMVYMFKANRDKQQDK